MAAVKTAVQQLLAGDSAETVMAEMRKTYTTAESMKKHMSLVRSKIMEGGHYSSSFDTTSLQKFAETPEIGAFLSANLKEQVMTVVAESPAKSCFTPVFTAAMLRSRTIFECASVHPCDRQI